MAWRILRVIAADFAHFWGRSGASVAMIFYFGYLGRGFMRCPVTGGAPGSVLAGGRGGIPELAVPETDGE
jgi:hypothetical protein